VLIINCKSDDIANRLDGDDQVKGRKGIDIDLAGWIHGLDKKDPTWIVQMDKPDWTSRRAMLGRIAMSVTALSVGTFCWEIRL
jgi:hypothetical protein